MSKLLLMLAGTLLVAAFHAAAVAAEEEEKVPAALNFKMRSLEGKQIELTKYQGRVLLIVNVASECGLTPQYEQLQQLHATYRDRGLAVLGFPCNQFGAQEPGSASEIRQFCTKNYGVQFDMFAKVQVNGEQACDLYKHLKAQPTKPKGPGEISWNFEKFLLDRQGNVAARFEPGTEPDAPEVVKLIEAELGKE